VPNGEDLAPLISGLQEANSAARQNAADAIFRIGRQLARSVVESWLADPAFAGCTVQDEAGFPKFTVGLAVHPEAFERIRAACGSPRLSTVPPDQDAKEFELDFPGGVRLDVLTTAEPGGRGAIARFLERSGEGIQQVELNVEDVDLATEILRTRFNLSPVYPASRGGADGTRMNFFLALSPQSRKVLIELVEDRRRNAR
jgi:hypothetical protein